jgi:hydroxyacylglutathione hydrolase
VQLEDHLGDIVRKACAANNISTTAAASAAGLSESEFTAFGESGQSAKKINFSALAQAVGLNATKLEALANGWLPAPKDLSQWRELRVIATQKEGLSVNAYLVWDEVQREAALFDTGVDAQPVLDVIAAEGLTLRHIFLTHSHWDHVDALPQFRAAWPKARVHTNSKSAPVDQRNKNSEIIHLGGLRITHRETPGHAEDGVTYLIGNWQEDAPHVAIVGDAIFAGSMGNGNGQWELAKQKVREQILSLPAETLLCPGHGPLTTVAEEKAHNPFF